MEWEIREGMSNVINGSFDGNGWMRMMRMTRMMVIT